jgi:hypothetical protein
MSSGNTNIYSLKHMQEHHDSFSHIKQNLKQFKHPSKAEWINKPWGDHKIKYYAATKKNEVLLHAT